MNIKTSVPLVSWPAVTTGNSAHLLALLFQMEQSQWWSADRLREHQFEQLSQLIEYSYQNVPYYRQLFDHCGIVPHSPLSEEQWRSIPLLERHHVQQRGDELIGYPTPPSHGDAVPKTTSGSTGSPLTVTRTALSGLFWSAITLRDHLWHRRDFAAKMGFLRYADPDVAEPPDGRNAPDWGVPANQVFNTGPSARLAIHSDLKQQVAWLLREEPDYLLTYPSNLEALADYFEVNGLKLDRLRQVRTLSEAFAPELRQRCQDVFDAPLVDMYSTQEVGYIALQCPDREHYHVQSEDVLVEVLDENNNPCAPGQIGRVVVTSLHNYGTILLRFDVGDYAEVGEPCACGRGLPVLNRILGRVRNMVTYPDGTRCWLNFVTLKHCRKEIPVQQVQMIQTSLNDLEVRIVAERSLTSAEEQSLQEMIHKDFKHPFSLTFTYHDQLLRDPSGKFEDFRSLI